MVLNLKWDIMDLHGILTAKMLDNINGLAAYHTYPHVDFEDTGRRAAKSLIRILKDGAKPVAARVRIPTLVRGNELITETGAFGAQMRYSKELEKHPDVMSAGMFICNPFTDVPELCCQPFVFTDNNQQLAEESVLKQAADFWPNRHIMQGQFTSLEDCVKIYQLAKKHKVPRLDLARCSLVVLVADRRGAHAGVVLEAVRIAAGLDVSLDKRVASGVTAVQAAASMGYDSVVEFLIGRGAALD